jgi:hypothetical protein
MPMVRRWAIFRIADETFIQVGAHPSKGLAAMEALRLASCTGAAHHIVEQILSRQAAVDEYTRLPALRRL